LLSLLNKWCITRA